MGIIVLSQTSFEQLAPVLNMAPVSISNVNLFVSSDPFVQWKKFEVIAVCFDLIGTIVFALILIRHPVQLAHHTKTNKVKEVIVLLKKLINEAIVLVKKYLSSGQTKSNKYQTNTKQS